MILNSYGPSRPPYKTMFLVVLLVKLYMLMINIVKMLFCTEEKMLFLNLLSIFLENMVIVEMIKTWL